MKPLNIKERYAVFNYKPLRKIHRDLDVSISVFSPKICQRLTQVQRKVFSTFKFQIRCSVKLKRLDVETNQFVKQLAYFLSSMRYVCTTSTIKQSVADAFEQIQLHLDNFVREGSGWVIDKIVNIQLAIVRIVKTLSGGCFGVTLPPALKRKQAIINIDCTDGRCFLYSIAAAMENIEGRSHPYRHKQYLSKIQKFNLNSLQFPVAIESIPNFEKDNPHLSINVFDYTDKMRIIYQTQNENDVTHICNLLLHCNHYFCIRNLSRLNFTSTKKQYVCSKCLFKFHNLEVYFNHIAKGCNTKKQPQSSYTVPLKDYRLKFTNVQNTIPAEFCIYADLETRNKIINRAKGPKTILHSRHIPTGFAAIRVCTDSNFTTDVVCYRGKNVMHHFFEYLKHERMEIRFIKRHMQQPLKMTEGDEAQFQAEKCCQYCKEVPSHPSQKCRDHNHFANPNLASNYRGVACVHCNLNVAAVNKKIPVFFHALTNYDSHFLLSHLHKTSMYKSKSCRIIPKNMERYMSFILGDFWFKDTFEFLPASLDTHVKNLITRGVDKFVYTKKFVGEENLQHVLRKGVYPYNYIKHLSQFDEVGLPSQKDFFNLLTKQHISDADYAYAWDIYRRFNCKSLGDFHDIYLKCDVTLLADVFENHRHVSMEAYDLDPAKYLSTPGLALDACLKSTGIAIQCLTDMEQYNMIESGIRGGISVISKRLATANNRYLPNFDPNLPESYLWFIDVNGLYSYTMAHYPMPIGDYSWLSADEISHFDLSQLTENDDFGFILDVDLHYPSHLHNTHAQYPLAPEKIVVDKNMKSPYTLKMAKSLKLGNSKLAKLIPNLMDKSNYVVHYLNLQFYLKMGLKLIKINRILKFKQNRFLEHFVNFNASMRSAATNAFEKNYYKLISNSCYGKFTENLKRRQKINLVRHTEIFDRLVRQIEMKQIRVFNNSLAGILLAQKEVELNRPLPIGYSILELSKLHMFKFHYEVVLPKFGDKIELCFTDTDSFLYHVETADLYKELKSLKSHLDTSNFPQDHTLFCSSNEKVPGLFQDEFPPPQIPQEFVGLKSKVYSIKYAQTAKKRAKGVSKHALVFTTHDHYKQCLLMKRVCSHKLHSIRSFDHKVYTIYSHKSCLNPHDDKRFILGDGITTLPYGHKDLPWPQDTR